MLLIDCDELLGMMKVNSLVSVGSGSQSGGVPSIDYRVE
jgi:hypothetical protein